MSRRTSDGFSCFTIDTLIGSEPPPPPLVSDTDDWSTSSPALQYVVSCSRLEDVGRSPPPTATRPSSSTFADGLERRRPVDELSGGGSRHAFRVYRPPSLRDAASARSEDGADLHGGILATLQRRAMSWYSSEVDNDRWRTPTLCDVSTGRRISDIASTNMSPAGHLHSSCKYRNIAFNKAVVPR